MTDSSVKHVRVAIIGSGPAGIGAAVGLAKRGVGPILLIERWDKPGGVPAKYPAKTGSVPTYIAFTRGRVLFGQQFVDSLLQQLPQTGVEFSLETSVIHLNPQRRQLTAVNSRQGKHVIQADAIVLATGAREQTGPERGWIAGNRQMPSLQTMQLLELLNLGKRLPWKNAVVAGSDLIAYAVAAKLKAAGTEAVHLIDATDAQQTSLLARWYFRRWVQPRWAPQALVRLMASNRERYQLEYQDGALMPCDAFVVSGQLIPNSELLVEAKIATKPPLHIPLTGSRGRLSSQGCFAAGNLLGGFHGGQWCYYNGMRVAKAVASYLQPSAES